MKKQKYSRVYDNLILCALAARDGKSQVAAKYLAEAIGDEGFDEDIDALDDMNNDALETDFGGEDELLAADEDFGDDMDDSVDVEDEVSDEEQLAQALARLHRARKLRATAGVPSKKRRAVKAADEETEDEDTTEDEETTEDDDASEESASLKARRQRQLANLRVIRSKKAKK